MFFAHLRSGTGGAIARLGDMMSQLLRADEGLAIKTCQLATLFGLSPAGLGERLAEFFRDATSPRSWTASWVRNMMIFASFYNKRRFVAR
jgi:hypothetical protein